VFKEAFEFLRQAVFLQRDLSDLKGDVAKLRRDLNETNETLRLVLFEIQRLSEREAHERETLELRFENKLLQHGRGLPSPKSRGKIT
jgi:hypothetical protein